MARNPIQVHFETELTEGKGLCNLRANQTRNLSLSHDWRDVTCVRCLNRSPSATTTACARCQGYGRAKVRRVHGAPPVEETCGQCDGKGVIQW